MTLRTVDRRSFVATLAASMAFASAAKAAPARFQPDAGLWRGLDLQDAAGRSFQLARDDRGAALTLVSLWAHWCPTCIAEMPALAAFAAAMGSRVDVLLVSHPEYWAEDLQAARRLRVPFRMATPTAINGPVTVRAALTQDGAYAVPRSMLFRNRDTTIARTIIGASAWSSPDMIASVKAMVG